MSTSSRLSAHKEIWFPNLPNLLDKAVEDYDLPNTGDWAPLDELSSATVFEGIDVYGDSAIMEGEKLVAPGNVYVELVYDPNSKEAVTFNDSYPVRVFFRVTDDKEIAIERIEVDTSSFYE